MALISIIMPVYNARKTINKMVDSIVAQSFTDWELIAVDDGSSDESGAILDKYASNDARIRVIHKQNGGVASARQVGIENATGVYTIHADADDWVEPDMLEAMHNKAVSEGSDIVICDYYNDIASHQSRYIKQTPESTESADVLKSLYFKNLMGSLCNKLIKKSVYDKTKTSFINGIDYCEDLLALTKMLTNANTKIAYLPQAYYHYVVNQSSLTTRVSHKGLNSMKRFHSEAVKILPSDGEFIDIPQSFALSEFIVLFTNKLYSNSSELQNKYAEIEDFVKTKHYGLRWRFGFQCIKHGFIPMAHKLIKF